MVQHGRFKAKQTGRDQEKKENKEERKAGPNFPSGGWVQWLTELNGWLGGLLVFG
jgi:hypothetical protein